MLSNEDMLRELHFLARRYCDGRQTYVVSQFNELTKQLLEQGIELDLTDGIVWARDGGGRDFDNLSSESATPGTYGALGKYIKPK